MTEEKCCTWCGETKPLDQFHRHKGSPDGRKPRCRECCNAETTARRRANPDYRAGWREADPDYMADYRAAHPEADWRSYYRHRARRFGFEPVVEDFTKADVIELYGDQCWHCKDAPFE